MFGRIGNRTQCKAITGSCQPGSHDHDEQCKNVVSQLQEREAKKRQDKDPDQKHQYELNDADDKVNDDLCHDSYPVRAGHKPDSQHASAVSFFDNIGCEGNQNKKHCENSPCRNVMLDRIRNYFCMNVYSIFFLEPDDPTWIIFKGTLSIKQFRNLCCKKIEYHPGLNAVCQLSECHPHSLTKRVLDHRIKIYDH